MPSNSSTLDDIIEENLQTRYDWSNDSIRTVLATPPVHNPLKDIGFSEYLKNRRQYLTTNDDDEKVRIVFRLPPFIQQVSGDFALKHKITHYKFLILILEMGIQHFDSDYADPYHTITDIKSSSVDMLTTPGNRMHYEQMRKYTISFPHYIRSENPLSPTVPMWLASSLKERAQYLNMCLSEFVYLCWCIGVQKSIDTIPSELQADMTGIMSAFEYQLHDYSDCIGSIRRKMDEIPKPIS